MFKIVKDCYVHKLCLRYVKVYYRENDMCCVNCIKNWFIGLKNKIKTKYNAVVDKMKIT